MCARVLVLTARYIYTAIAPAFTSLISTLSYRFYFTHIRHQHTRAPPLPPPHTLTHTRAPPLPPPHTLTHTRARAHHQHMKLALLVRSSSLRNKRHCVNPSTHIQLVCKSLHLRLLNGECKAKVAASSKPDTAPAISVSQASLTVHFRSTSPVKFCMLNKRQGFCGDPVENTAA